MLPLALAVVAVVAAAGTGVSQPEQISSVTTNRVYAIALSHSPLSPHT